VNLVSRQRPQRLKTPVTTDWLRQRQRGDRRQVNTDKDRWVKRLARSADWQTAVSRIDNPQVAAQNGSIQLSISEPKFGRPIVKAMAA